MNLCQQLASQVSQRGAQAAIIAGRQQLSYAELADAAGAMAGGLQARGITAGDRVLLMLPMGLDLYIALFACWQIGAAACFVDPGTDHVRLAAIVRRLAPRAYIAHPLGQLLRWWKAPLRAIPIACAIGFPWLARPLRNTGTSPAMATVTAEHPAILTATSGSTGEPKIVVRSHGFLAIQAEILARHLALEPGSADLATLPVFALVDLAAGATCVIADGDLRRPGHVAPGPIAIQIARHQIRSVAASPAFCERLLEADAAQLTSLRRVATGGAPVFPDLLDRLAAQLPQAAIAAVYGSTEAEPMADLPLPAIGDDDRVAMRSGAGLLAGTIVDEIDLRIAAPDALDHQMDDQAFAAACLPNETVGEILVAGPHVIAGYLDGRGDRENKVHAAGRCWHRSGDLGRLDAQGRLWLLGRVAAAFRHRDQMLYPFAIECAARDCLAGRRCALGRHGSEAVLVVDGHGPVPANDDLQALCQRHGIDQILALPIPLDRRHNAKVDHPALQATIEEHYHGQ